MKKKLLRSFLFLIFIITKLICVNKDFKTSFHIKDKINSNTENNSLSLYLNVIWNNFINFEKIQLYFNGMTKILNYIGLYNDDKEDSDYISKVEFNDNIVEYNNHYNEGILNNINNLHNNSKGRNLEYKKNCSGVGEIKDFTIGGYYCNDKLVTKEEYDKGKDCKIIYVEKKLCICPTNFEGKYCQIVIPNLCSFKTITLNTVELTKNYDTFYKEYLDRPKYYIENQRKLKFQIEIECSLNKPITDDRVTINESTYVNHDTKRHFIEYQKDGKDIRKEYKFEDYKKGRINLRSTPKVDDFFLELSFYNMNNMMKIVSYDRKMNLEELELFLNSNKKIDFEIDLSEKYNVLIEKCKVMNSLIYQLNLRHIKQFEKIDNNDKDESFREDISILNRNLIRIYVYNGILGLSPIDHLQVGLINGERIKSNNLSFGGKIIIILCVILVIVLVIYFLIKYKKKISDKSSEKIESNDVQIVEKLDDLDENNRIWLQKALKIE